MKTRFGITRWLWVFTGCALGGHVAGARWGLTVTLALLLVQLGHQGWRAWTAGTLPLQVRILALAVFLLGTWPPLRVLHFLQLAGITTLTVFDYCIAGRALSLLPWNRKRALTLAVVRAAFLSPRRPGCRFAAQEAV